MAQALSSASALGDWRLLFLQRDRARGRHRRRRQPRRQDLLPASTTAPSACTSREDEPQRLAIPAAPAARRAGQGLQGRRRSAAAGEAFDPTPANLDARTKVVDAGRAQGGPAAEEEPRRDGVAGADPALRQRGRRSRARRPRPAMLPALMMAGTKKHDRQALREELDAAGRPHHARAGRRRPGRRRRRRRRRGGTPGQLTFSVEAKRATLPGGPRAARRNPPRAGLPGGRVRPR